ncbi:MAG: HTH domain-containing protein [Nanoarchaeota archaeon]|nr:HTH domain-containing protein [Nanoarchaeota archaeon]
MEDRIIKELKDSKEGLTITELVGRLKSSRFTVRNNLSRLEWADKVSVRKVGMAKIYSLSKRRKK